MSGIYIPNMKMPKSCAGCYFKYVAFEGIVKCDLAGHDFKDYRETGYREDCPLILVPDHGRLVDVDALYEKFMSAPPAQFTPEEVAIMVDWEEVAPTVIPADKEGAE